MLEKSQDFAGIGAETGGACATITGFCEGIMAHCTCMSLTGVDRCNHLVADTPS